MKLIDLNTFPVRPVLHRLLQDKTTKHNIIFATDAYAAIGEGFGERDEITLEKLTDSEHCVLIQPRVEKALDEQQARTRTKGEVMTPSWIINKMNNHCDTDYFGREGVFNTEHGQSWETNTEPVSFPAKKTWKNYVDSKRIEITCGEAPYIVSRYDATTGEIIPIKDRIGILDRKLRVVSENAADDDEWLFWARRAFESSYGYEFQGDSLLIARVNLLLTFTEYYESRFHASPGIKLLREYATIICWNFWQMDGLSGTIPFAVPESERNDQCSLLGFEDAPQAEAVTYAPSCRVMDWRSKCSISYDVIRGGNKQ